VQWDGSSVFSDAKSVTQYSGFCKLGTAQVQATGASSDLSFGAFDQQQDVILDDVSMSSAVSGEAQAPEPATLGLLGSALFGLVLIGRKNGNSRA
jgi:PEP-CTERM motif